MPNRRMFSNRIANSARFLQMPAESQLLYFHLVLRADDDGVVEAYPILKLLGLAPDNFKVLLAKGFIRQLNEEQVIVIMDWREHNTIRPDRKIDSIYINLLREKVPELPLLTPVARVDTGKKNTGKIGRPIKWAESGHKLDGISQVKLSKDNTKKHTSLFSITNEDLSLIAIKNKLGIESVQGKLEQLKLYCESTGKKYKNYRATLEAWIVRDLERGSLKQLSEEDLEAERVLNAPEPEGARSFIDKGI